MPTSARFARLLYRSTRPTVQEAAVDMVKRERQRPKAEIVTESASFKPAVSVKARQAWKYPGNNIVRAPGLFLGPERRGPYTDPKEPNAGTDAGMPRRKQESNFFITINPNKVVSDAQLSATQSNFEQTLTKLQGNEELTRYLKFGPKDEHYIGDHAVDVIGKIDYTCAVEVGEVQRRMHAHIWMTIEHYSQVQINVPMLQHEFAEAYGTPDKLPYVQVKLLPQSDWTSVMRQYIKKGMTDC